MRKFLNLFRSEPKNSVALKRSAAAAPASNLLMSLMNKLPIDQSWLDYTEMDRITRDATVISSYGSRKAATLKKELIVESSNKTLKEAIENTFNYKTLRKILDAPMQGCAILNSIGKMTLTF